MDNNFFNGLQMVEDAVREIDEDLRSPDLTDERRVSLLGKLAEIATDLDRIRDSLRDLEERRGD
jgi:hypothetical protein